MEHTGDQEHGRQARHHPEAVKVAGDIDQEQAERRPFDQIRVRANGGQHLGVAAVAQIVIWQMLRKKIEMPTADRALPGRAQAFRCRAEH